MFIYIIILNYNNSDTTLECLESVFQLSYHNIKVIVCDNNSIDNSIEITKKWAEGNHILKEKGISSNNIRIKQNILPPSHKPIKYVEYTRNEIESAAYVFDKEAKLILIKNGKNLGFAGGNNIGLKYVLKQGDFKYVWLLNNDTVVDKNALTELVKKTEEGKNIGICGSTLLYSDKPDMVQVYGGGRYNPRIGNNFTNGGKTRYSEESATSHIKNKITDVRGASMLVSKAFLLRVGLLNEKYFLYMEEQDWAERGRRLGFNLTYAPKSIVYHKEGGSIGCSNRGEYNISAYGKHHFFLSRLIFTKIYYPQYLLTIYARTILAVVFYMLRGKLHISKAVFSAFIFFVMKKRHEL